MILMDVRENRIQTVLLLAGQALRLLLLLVYLLEWRALRLTGKGLVCDIVRKLGVLSARHARNHVPI